MAAQTDFWGDIAPAQVRTPVAIMKEQAALLGKKTQNVVEGRVASAVHAQQFVHRFHLVVPALDGYTYELFRVAQEIDIYPLITDEGTRLENEEAFTNWLRAKLSSDKTKKILGNLLAQANS
ncbi:hypothetical protein SBA3_1700005 [Candidatus Sulfopaludibacter sp. SbA3]|nr:hypothetical protein SBA3_1700005 [Candidatus Sulfopaludibacter sp. SbA3]